MPLTTARSRYANAYRLAALGAACFFLFGPTSSSAQSPAAERGLRFARTHCGKCHSLDKLSPSPLAAAPPFRALHARYPVDTLEEALGEGIVTGHPSMPEFRLEPDQIRDFISYLNSLR